jgi:hypothetical protein
MIAVIEPGVSAPVRRSPVWMAVAVTGSIMVAGYISLGVAAGGGVWLYCMGSIANLVLGLLLWSRRPDNRLGRMLAAIGVLGPLSGLAILGGFGGIDTSFSPSGWRSIVGAVGGAPATGLVLLSLLWFPDGHLPTPRWRWLERTVVGWTVLWGVAGLLGRPLDGADHPFVSPSTADAFALSYEILLVGFGALLLAAAWALGARYRRADPIGRLQLRWLFFVVGGYVVFWSAISIAIPVGEWGTVGLLVDALFLASLPVAMAIAVLRYRLYEIDRIISRTVTYSLVAVAVAAVYALPVIALPRLIGESSDLLIAGSTLAAAAVFDPVRRRVQRMVDRRFNRARYDIEREIDAAGSKIHRQVDLHELARQVTDTIGRTLQPASTSLWIRPW